MAVDVPGVISIVVFYILILAVGIWAGRKSAKSASSTDAFLANRNMGLFVSFFTLTGTYKLLHVEIERFCHHHPCSYTHLWKLYLIHFWLRKIQTV